MAQTILRSPGYLALEAQPRGQAASRFPPASSSKLEAHALRTPHRLGLPLSRLSIEEIRQQVIAQGLVAEIGSATLWRWLSTDALRPWRHRSWIFPRDPNFAAKAGPVLDLYERIWEGAPLGANDFVISADEKTSIQARRRKTLDICRLLRTNPPGSNMSTLAKVPGPTWRPGCSSRQVFGRLREVKNGMAPVERLVSEVMNPRA